MRAVPTLRRWLEPSLAFVHRARLNSIWIAVEAVSRGGVLSLTALGRASARQAKAKHRIKAMDRLMGNRRLHADLQKIYRSVASLIVVGERPVVLVDWTQVGAKHCALTAAVPTGGRAIPVYSETHELKHLGNPGVESRFLRSLKSLLPAGRRPTVVSDAGFASAWFNAVERLGWDFVGRVRRRTLVRATDGDWVSNKVLHRRATTTASDLGQFQFPRIAPRLRRLVLVRKPARGRVRIGRRGEIGCNAIDRKHARSAREPWLLTTSLSSPPADVVSIYAQRMQIEELFRDAKNHRFGWCLGDVVAHCAARLDVLLLIATLGIIAMTLLGLAIETAGLQRRYQANTIRNRRVISLFVLGTLATAAEEGRPPPGSVAAALSALQRWATTA